jgi:type IV secretory pathway VirB2 component (pilin)
MDTRLISFLIFATLFSVFFPEISFATTSVDTPIGNTLCTAASWANGNMGAGIATLSIIIMGILALLGKVSWNLAILHVVGVALLVGASSFISSLNAGASGC